MGVGDLVFRLFDLLREAVSSEKPVKWAAAGGITLSSLEKVRKSFHPSVVIVGTAITKAENPKEAARQLKQAIEKGE